METKYASFFRRAKATLADAFILIIIINIINILLLPLHLKLLEIDLSLAISIGVVEYFIITSLYHIISWVKYDGATIGKKLADIKIVRKDGTKMNYKSSIARALGYWVSTIGLMIGYLWVLWDKNNQGWHDKIAKTYVVEVGKGQRKVLLWFLIIGYIIFTLLNGFL